MADHPNQDPFEDPFEEGNQANQQDHFDSGSGIPEQLPNSVGVLVLGILSWNDGFPLE